MGLFIGMVCGIVYRDGLVVFVGSSSSVPTKCLFRSHLELIRHWIEHCSS